VSPATFEADYLSGAGTPVIVTDAIDGWQAKTTWTFEFFGSRYGSQTILVEADTPGGRVYRVMTLADYIDYVQNRTERLPGLWADAKTGLPLTAPLDVERTRLYLAGKWNAFMAYPELLDDIEPTPYFVDDWVPLFPQEFLRLLQTTNIRPYWILLGPKGSVTRLHRDFLHTHAYLAQLVGRKRCVLFSPDDSAFLYDGHVDPAAPDFDRFPLFERATPFECVIEPGEMLFLPSDWWHCVVGLDSSITVSYNFFNRSNFGDYFVDFMKALPSTLRSFDKTPGWQQMLGVDWVCKGFDRTLR